jgi:hypothetical protein
LNQSFAAGHFQFFLFVVILHRIETYTMADLGDLAPEVKEGKGRGHLEENHYSDSRSTAINGRRR